jgi:iron complex outermembrane receptor protein
MKRAIAILAMGTGLPLVLASPALAQNAAAASDRAASAPAGDYADIIVTAQRRETSVRDVPFSIAAFSGQQIQRQEIHNPQQLIQQLPGIAMNTGDKSISIAAIRGNVSTFRTATLDAPVAFFVDDIYYPYTTDLNTNFFDLNRVEVLRGPQGTLFGRNVVGGAIAVITNNPTFDDDYQGRVSAGNGGYIRTEGMLNGALVDGKVAARITFSSEHTDGLIDTPNQRGNYGEDSSYAVRGKLLFTPTDTLKIIASADYSYSDGNGAPVQLSIGGPQVIPSTFGNFVNKHWTNSDTAPAPNNRRLRGGYLRGDLDLFQGTLTAITGYRLNDSYYYLSQMNVPGPSPQDFESTVRNRSFTQEVRFASAPGRLSFVAGAFYLHGNFHTINTLGYNPLAGSAFLAAVAGAAPIRITRDQRGIVNSIAGFGQATFKITEGLQLEAGGRYTHDHKDVDYRADSSDGLAVPGLSFSQVGVAGRVPFNVRATGGKTWTAFTPRVSLKFEPVKDINLYATYAKGFKSGGYVDNSYRNPTLPLEPERATNYEVGIKSRLFGNLLDLNVTAFRQVTKNLQNFSGAGGIPHTYNGSTLVKGIELESVLRPVSGVRLTFNYAYLDHKYTDLRDPVVGVNFAGNPVKYTPKNAFTIGGDYGLNMSSGAAVNFHADYSYSSRTSTSDDFAMVRTPNIYDETIGSTLNGQVTYDSPSKRWSLTFWGKNITNHFQVITGDNVTAFLTTPPTSNTIYWRTITNQPRTYGFTVTLRR